VSWLCCLAADVDDVAWRGWLEGIGLDLCIDLDRVALQARVTAIGQGEGATSRRLDVA